MGLNKLRSMRRRLLRCETLEDRRLLAVDFLPGDTAFAPAVNDQQFVALEKSDSGFLAVWMDERPVLSGFVNTSSPLNGNGQDIYGQVLNAQGQPLGDPLVIASMGHNQSKPDIAWNPTAHAWLVAFDSQDPDWYFHEQVYGVRVAGNGDLLDAEPQLLFEQDGNQGIFDVDVASDGTNWAIVATKFYGSPLEGAVFGRRMSADGQMLDLQPQLIATGDLMMPDIEYANDGYVIASKHRTTDQMYITRTDVTLEAIGGNTFVGDGYYSGPRLSSNGNEYLLIGEAAHRISSTGQVLDVGGIAIGGSGFAAEHRNATWNGTNWSVGFVATGGDIGLQRIDVSGALVDTEPLIAAAEAVGEQIALGGSGGTTVVAFSDRPGFDQNIRGVRFDAGGDSTPTPYDLSVGLARQSYVTAVDGPGAENLVVFVSQVSGETRVMSQRIADDGSIIDPEPTIVATEPTTTTVTPDVAWNGSGYLVVWDNMAQRLSASNEMMGAPFAISNLPTRGIAAANDTFIVGSYESYTVHHQRRYRAYFSRVASDGTLLDSSPVFIDGGSPSNMSAATFGERVIFSYSPTKAVFIADDGTLSAPIFYANSSAGSTDIAVNNDTALFVYTTSDGAPNESSIMGRFVHVDGTTPTWEFTISDAPGQQLTPDVGWIGDQFVVAWSDYRHIEGIQQQRGDIRAARVTADGTVREPLGFTVTSSAAPEDLPAVVGGDGNAWILFSGLHGPGGSEEVQRIGYQFGPLVDYPLREFERSGIPGGFATISSGNLGVLLGGESHQYEITLAPSEQASAIVIPQEGHATLSAQFLGHGAPVSASGPGEALHVPLASLPAGGTLTLSISSDTTTEYAFDIHRNENIHALLESSDPVAIDDARLALGRNSQYAAIGHSNGQAGGNGFQHYNDPGLFVDISTTGTSLVLDDGFYGKRAFVTTTIGNDLLPAGLITVARDGVVVGGFNDVYLGSHQTIPDSFYLGDNPAIAPLWQILGANNANGLGANGAVYFEERVVNGINAVIVQWDDIPAWNDFGAATFQIQVFESGPLKARYVYEDIIFGNPTIDGGAAASVGLQRDGNSGYQFSFETRTLADGDVLDFLDLPTTEDVDDFTVDLIAGETIDVALKGVGRQLNAATLELLDPNGNLITTGQSSYGGQAILNFDLGILGQQLAEDGTYTMRVRSAEEAEYELLVTREVGLEVETPVPSLPRQIDLNTGAMGSLSGKPSLAGYDRYNDPGRFIDISASGTALFFDHGDGVTPVYSHVSNALMPGEKFLVGSDGALMLDEAIDYFSGDFVQSLPSLSFDLSALVPFATDLENDTGAVYYEERMVDGVNTLIVQWHNRSYFFQSGTGTFQLQLFDRDPSAARQRAARFVYADIDFDNPQYNGGTDATVGVQLDQTSAELISSQSASISDGDVIDFYYEAGDRFEATLHAGETITLHTLTPLDDVNIVPANSLDPGIAILDASGQVLAFDSDSVDGKNAGLEFTAPTSGDYQIVIYTEDGHGEYVIQTTPGQSLRDGDFNNNGAYEIADIDQLIQRISSFSQDPVFDLNGDSRVDLADRDLWLTEAGTNNLPSKTAYVPGDANLDGVVDGGDFLIWNANKFQETGSWGQADFNADGTTNGRDFLIWNANRFSGLISAKEGLSLTYGSTVRESGQNKENMLAKHKTLVDLVFSTSAANLAAE